MPIKQGKTSQHHNWPRYMDCPQVGSKSAIKLVKKHQKDKWCLFRVPTPPPPPGVYVLRSFFFLFWRCSVWKSYRKRVRTIFLAFDKSTARCLDCLPQARGSRTGKNTLYIKYLYCQFGAAQDVAAVEIVCILSEKVVKCPHGSCFRAELKVTHLRWQRPICGFLRFSANICGFLRFPASSKCLSFQEKGWICENLRFSAKICVLRVLCHLSSVTLSAPWCLLGQKIAGTSDLAWFSRKSYVLRGLKNGKNAFNRHEDLNSQSFGQTWSTFCRRKTVWERSKVANPFAPYRGQNPKIGKRGFRSQKNPISPHPRKGRFESKKSPFLYRAPQGTWGFFDSRRPFLGWGEIRRRTNVQQLTCKIDSYNSFYYLFFSFVLLELKPFVFKWKVLGEKFWKSAKKCENYEKLWNDFAL